MAIIKRYSPLQNLKNFDVFIEDNNPDSQYFNITELGKTLTGGKNAFLFDGSPFFVKGTKVRFEATDVDGNPLFIEPGRQGDRTFREGTSIVMAIHVYDDTPIGIGTLTILAELETYIDANGVERNIPDEFRGTFNARYTQNFKINPKIPNSTQVRFFKRPTFTVTEIEKQLLIKTNMSLSKSGSIIGIPEIPDTGSDFSTWTAPSQYRIKLQEGNKFTQSMDENTTLVVSDLGYSSSVLEVLNEDEMLVRKPYLKDNIVNEFTPVSYSMDFESVEDATVNTGSNVIASYAEIRLENLKTFTGDVARIKIFRKSRNDLGDFQVVQENKLDSTELLRDFSVPNRTVINYGKLRRENIVSEAGDVYYTTSSGVKIHNQHLINSLLVSSSHTVESNGTIGEFEIVSGSEYSLSYKSRFIGLGDTSQSFADENTLEFLLVTSSNNVGNTIITTQSIDIQTGSNEIGPPIGVKFKSGSGDEEFFHTEHDGCGISNQQNVTKNFFAEISGKCQIRIKADTQVNGENNFPTGSFVFGTLSLKNAEESSYSPDEYTAIVDIPRKNPTEQFDFRVEFYDINNNFIPIKVEQSVPFTKGNQSRILETAVNVSASGVADAGDILSVDGGVVQIASTNIQSSTIAGLGDPTVFQGLVAAATSSLESKTTQLSVATASLESQTTQLSISTASLEGTTLLLNAETASLQQKHTALATETASLQAETASLKLATSSLELTTASIEAQTASLQLATASLQAETASLQSETASLQLATASLELTTASIEAQTASLQLATASLEQTTASLQSETASLQLATASLELTTASLQATSASLLTSASENRVINPTTGKIIRESSIPSSGNGLFINDEKLGFVSESVPAALISSSGEFFLSGSNANNFLRWDGEQLFIGGNIILTNGSPDVDLTPLNDFTSSQSTTNTNLLLSSSVSGAIDPATGKITKNPTPSGTGLFLGADNLGYYESDTWKTYMSSSGQFFLSGSGNNSLEWTGEQLQIKGDITASTGNIGGFTLDDSKLIGFVNAGATKAVQLDSGQSGDWTFDGDDVGGFLLTTSGSGAVDSIVNNAWVAEPNQKKFYFRVGSDNQFIKFQQRDSAGGLEISASNFSVSGSVVEAKSASFEHVSIASKDNVFSVSPAGRMIANNATVEGDISASGGSIGGFTIQGDQLLGNNSSIVLDGSATPKIRFISSSVDIVTLSSQNSLSPIDLGTAPTMLGSSFGSQNDSDTESGVDFFGHSVSLTQSPTILAEAIATSSLRFPNTGGVVADFDGVTATFAGTLDPQTASNPFVDSDLDAFNGVIGFASNTCKIGIRIKKSDGTVVSSTERTLTTSYIGTNASSHQLGTSGSHAFSLGVDLESGSNYSFETFIKDGTSFISTTTGGCSITSVFRTPDIGSISVNVPTSNTIQPFTEISRGGFQVVSDADSSNLKVVKLPADQTAANALSVSGSIEASGNITAFASSDERLKENITTIPDSLEKVKNLRGILFNWKDGYTPKVHPYGTNRDIGVIAQEIQKVLPEVVKENVHNKFLGVKYEKLTPLLLEAIKELSDRIENLENKLKDK